MRSDYKNLTVLPHNKSINHSRTQKTNAFYVHFLSKLSLRQAHKRNYSPCKISISSYCARAAQVSEPNKSEFFSMSLNKITSNYY